MTISPTSNGLPPYDRESAVGRAYAYSDDILAGRIVACQKVKDACTRFARELGQQSDPAYPWRFDEDKAARPIRFIEKYLTPTKGDYDSMTLMPWQCFCEANMYGWVDKTTGLRRFREALIIVGTGNGKSTLLSGNATYAACADGEQGADIYLLANSKDQANIVFNECLAQIRNSPKLDRCFRTLRDGVYFDSKNASIRSRSSDSKRLDGLNPHVAIFDEIHEYRDFKLINIIRQKTVKRRQPLVVYITTMGYVPDGPLAYYYDLFTDAMRTDKLSAEVADRMFAYIAELDPTDDPNDSDAWIKANPSLGVLLQKDVLISQWERDKNVPAQRANFICKQLNVMVNADDMSFVQPEVIRRNEAMIDPESLLGRQCYGGFDLSTREDFTAAALEFPLDDGRVFVLTHSWVPRRKVELDNEKIDYYGLAMRGYLSIVDGEYIQQEDVFNWFVEQNKKYEIECIGYDPANATRLRQMLDNAGFCCEVVRQGPLTLNDPMKDIKELLLGGRVVSNKDPMLAWYVDNVRISGERRHMDKENWMPTKHNRYRKIDGYMAWLFAHTVDMQRNPVGIENRVVGFRTYDLSKRKEGRRNVSYVAL